MMNTYISLLRGINVSGQKIIKMAALKAMYESLGYKNVQTYIQSGNVIFQTKEKDPARLMKLIADKIKKDFGYDVTVVLRSADEFKTIIKNNPFDKPEYDTKKIAVVFLSEPINQNTFDEFVSAVKGNEKFVYLKNEIYGYYTDGYGRSKVDSNFIERKLKTRTTARNWNTTTKLFELATSGKAQ